VIFILFYLVHLLDILCPAPAVMKSICFSLVVVAQCAVASYVRRDNGTGNYTGSPCAVVS